MAGDNKSVKLKIDNVYKEYDTSKGKMVALNGANLDIAENEFICVVGPSGCGKSTLLNIIAGLLEPTSGTVYLDGKPIEGTGMERGVVFQQYALFPWRTVLKNVMFGPEMKKMPKNQAEEIARKYIKAVGLEGFENSYPKELSGGMKRRLSIACALVENPPFLLMDEPTTALDLYYKESIHQWMKTYQQKNGIILMTTHDESEIRNADRCLFMDEGKVQELDAEDILQKFAGMSE